MRIKGHRASPKAMRKFFKLGFSPESSIGRAAELVTYDLAGFGPQTIHEAARSGKPMPGFDYSLLAEGKRINALPNGIILTLDRSLHDSLDFDVVVNPLGWKIISNRLGNIVKKIAGDDIELLPVAIFGREGKILRSDFCVMNVLQTLPVISELKTVRSRDKSSVLKLAVVQSKVSPKVHVFRVKEWRWPVLIDEVVQQALIKAPHDGLTFSLVEVE